MRVHAFSHALIEGNGISMTGRQVAGATRDAIVFDLFALWSIRTGRWLYFIWLRAFFQRYGRGRRLRCRFGISCVARMWLLLPRHCREGASHEDVRRSQRRNHSTFQDGSPGWPGMNPTMENDPGRGSALRTLSAGSLILSTHVLLLGKPQILRYSIGRMLRLGN